MEIKKISGSIIIEPLIALNVLGVILLLSILSVSNLAKSATGFIVVDGVIEMEKLMDDPNIEEDIYSFNNYEVELTIDPYPGYNKLAIYNWVIRNSAGTLLLERNKIKKVNE